MFKTKFIQRILRLTMAAMLFAAMSIISADSYGQVKGQAKAKQPDFIPAGYDDYQSKLDRLGIKKIRPGSQLPH